MENIDKCEDISEQERLILALIFGKIKNDLEKIGGLVDMQEMEVKMAENVKHPSHYVEGKKFEPKDVIRDWGLNFNLGSAVKYVSRAGRKDDIVQDLKKAQEFIQFEIDVIEAERAKGIKPTEYGTPEKLYGSDIY